jgi:hypothetical protein
VDILEHHPILTIIMNPFFILVGFGIGFEIENVPAILLLGENPDNRGRVPMGRRKLLCLSGMVDAFLNPIGAERQNVVCLQLARNLLRSKALQSHAINPAHHLGGFFIDDPVLRIARVFGIAIGRLAERLPGVALNLVADAPLLADVPGIPLVR